MHRVAVIVPIHNTDKYLPACIESIIAQEYTNLDIILVDDGSDDKSLEICSRYKEQDERIKVLHQSNKGVLSAKCLGIENTDAEYIMFVDSDDWIKSDMCGRLLEVMEKQDVDLVASGIIRYFSEKNCIYDYNALPEGKYEGNDYQDYILSHMLCDGVFPRRGIDASLAIKIFKKNLLYPVIKKAKEEYGFLLAEDTAVLYPYMLNASSIYIMEECFYYHRQYKNHQDVYYEDEDYEFKLNKLYQYLKVIFEQYDNREILFRQLDYFVAGSLYGKYENRAMKIIQKPPKIQQYLFPFQDISKGSTILLYGAGAVGQSFYAQLIKTDYCKSIIWQDRQYEEYRKSKLPVRKVELRVFFDYCVIAVQDKRTADEIRNELLKGGVEHNKIIWKNPLLNMW
ncbi:putative glycosyltransferase EpsJ [Lachnospiraceae bacterium]|nr:putative glycosyltransferase EpsJ [Lachnospiraceae bacterium]